MGRKSRLKKMRKAQASDNGHAGKTTTKNKKQNGGRQRNWTDYTLIAVIIIVLVTALYFVGDLNESTVGEDDQGAEPTGVFENYLNLPAGSLLMRRKAGMSGAAYLTGWKKKGKKIK